MRETILHRSLDSFMALQRLSRMYEYFTSTCAGDYFKAQTTFWSWGRGEKFRLLVTLHRLPYNMYTGSWFMVGTVYALPLKPKEGMMSLRGLEANMLGISRLRRYQFATSATQDSWSLPKAPMADILRMSWQGLLDRRGGGGGIRRRGAFERYWSFAVSHSSFSKSPHVKHSKHFKYYSIAITFFWGE